MTNDKCIELLECLKEEIENTMNSSDGVQYSEALSMTIELLQRGIDLATQNEELKCEYDKLKAKMEDMAIEIQDDSCQFQILKEKNAYMCTKIEVYREVISQLLREMKK